MRKTNEEDIARFSGSFGFWAEKLSLNDWDWRITVGGMENDNAVGCFETQATGGGRKALIRIGDEYEEEYTGPEEIAKHEALEMLLGDIGNLLRRYYSADLVAEEIHRVINRLMPLLREDTVTMVTDNPKYVRDRLDAGVVNKIREALDREETEAGNGQGEDSDQGQC